MTDKEIERLTEELKFAVARWKVADYTAEEMRKIALIFGSIAMLACLALAGVCIWLLCK